MQITEIIDTIEEKARFLWGDDRWKQVILVRFLVASGCEVDALERGRKRPLIKRTFDNRKAGYDTLVKLLKAVGLEIALIPSSDRTTGQ